MRLLVVFDFFFACYRPAWIPISEANYARPREFKKKKEKASKTEVRYYFLLVAHCVFPQWAGINRQAEIGKYTHFWRFLDFFGFLEAKFHTY